MFGGGGPNVTPSKSVVPIKAAPLARVGVKDSTAVLLSSILYMVKLASLTDQSVVLFLASPRPEASGNSGLKLLLMLLPLSRVRVWALPAREAGPASRARIRAPVSVRLFVAFIPFMTNLLGSKTGPTLEWDEEAIYRRSRISPSWGISNRPSGIPAARAWARRSVRETRPWSRESRWMATTVPAGAARQTSTVPASSMTI